MNFATPKPRPASATKADNYQTPVCNDCQLHTHARDYFATWGICKWCMNGTPRGPENQHPEDIPEVTE